MKNYAKQVQIRSLISDGLCPAMIVIDCVASDCKWEVNSIEGQHANLLRSYGIAVENGGMPRIDPQYVENELETFRTLREMFLYD